MYYIGEDLSPILKENKSEMIPLRHHTQNQVVSTKEDHTVLVSFKFEKTGVPRTVK